MKKKRIDVLLVELGLAASRERAQSLIMTGNILADDVPVTKAGALVAPDSDIRVRGEDHPYVSRGGIKLAAALDEFKIDVAGRTALDIGASTGGFTQVMLIRGAQKVYAVDVGHDQLDWKIRKDPRVVVHEKTNARAMTFDLVGEKVGLITVDVSFISLEKILTAALQFSTPETDWITLIKPQFEAGRESVGKGGIVRDESVRQAVVDKVSRFADTLGLGRRGLIESPITGTQGNKEYLAHWKLTAKYQPGT